MKAPNIITLLILCLHCSGKELYSQVTVTYCYLDKPDIEITAYSAYSDYRNIQYEWIDQNGKTTYAKKLNNADQGVYKWKATDPMGCYINGEVLVVISDIKPLHISGNKYEICIGGNQYIGYACNNCCENKYCLDFTKVIKK